MSLISTSTNSTYYDHPKLAALKRADFGLFGATWWPCTSYERLQVVTELSIWLFVWDDEIDSIAGTFANSLDKAHAFRRSTLEFISSSLGLSGSGELPNTANTIIRAFDSFGQRLRAQCPFDQRVGLLREIQYFMNKSEIEQRHALSGHVVSFEEYWEFRMGTSAVRVALAVNEYTCGFSLPKSLINHPVSKRRPVPVPVPVPLPLDSDGKCAG